MDSNPDEKFLKNEYIDRISDLPESIRGQILSYLPTKYAVATSILSTKWKNIFPFGVPPIKLGLDDSLLLHPQQYESNSPSRSFMNFADKLLNETICDVPCVDALMLICQRHYGDAKIVSWVSAALRYNVRLLVIYFFLNDSEVLFHCLNGCTTLTRLELGKNFDLRLPGNFTLPNLKRLDLSKLTFLDDTKSINELLDGCPVLENLWLDGCNSSLLGILRIRSPLLKTLCIEDCWTESDCELMLDVPDLEWLIYKDCAASYYSLTDFESLVAVHIHVGPSIEQLDGAANSDDEDVWYFDSDIAKLVTACSSTIYLYLSDRTIAALQRSLVQLPEFLNLTFLALGCMGIQGWKLLACLLESAPNLESLQIEEGFNEYEGGYASFESSLPILPICLKLHLKRIEFCVFKGEEDEIKLIEFFMKNGKVLRQIKVFCLPYEDMSVLMRLFMFQRLSKSCRILLDLASKANDVSQSSASTSSSRPPYDVELARLKGDMEALFQFIINALQAAGLSIPPIPDRLQNYLPVVPAQGPPPPPAEHPPGLSHPGDHVVGHTIPLVPDRL